MVFHLNYTHILRYLAATSFYQIRFSLWLFWRYLDHRDTIAVSFYQCVQVLIKNGGHGIRITLLPGHFLISSTQCVRGPV
jgi:hypothetical protein